MNFTERSHEGSLERYSCTESYVPTGRDAQYGMCYLWWYEGMCIIGIRYGTPVIANFESCPRSPACVGRMHLEHPFLRSKLHIPHSPICANKTSPLYSWAIDSCNRSLRCSIFLKFTTLAQRSTVIFVSSDGLSDIRFKKDLFIE